MKKSFLFSILFLSAIASAQVPTYVPLDNLVGWWPFNGNGNDDGDDGPVNEEAGQRSLSGGCREWLAGPACRYPLRRGWVILFALAGLFARPR